MTTTDTPATHAAGPPAGQPPEKIGTFLMRRLPLRLRHRFKAACAAAGSSMEAEITHFMKLYAEQYEESQRQQPRPRRTNP
jgi:hypothetical protein